MPAKKLVTVQLTQDQWVTIMARLLNWPLSDKGDDVFNAAKRGLFAQACRDPRKGKAA